MATNIFIPTATCEHVINPNNYQDSEEGITLIYPNNEYPEELYFGYSIIPTDINLASEILANSLADLENCINNFIRLNHTGDDEYYDYLPDYLFQIYCLALAINAWESTAETITGLLHKYQEHFNQDDPEKILEPFINHNEDFYKDIKLILTTFNNQLNNPLDI